MSYNMVYIGAYIEIECNKIEYKIDRRRCSSGHEHSGLYAYCPVCGEQIQTWYNTELVYPRMICDDILPFEYEDILWPLQVAPLQGTGVILAIDNLKAAGCYTQVRKWSGSSVLPVPRKSVLATLESDIANQCKDIIVALKRASAVKEVSIKSGIIITREE